MKIKITLIIVSLLIFASNIIYSQQSEDEKIAKETMEAYSTKSFEDFQRFIKENINKISSDLIRALSYVGMKYRNENMLLISLISVQEKGNDTVLADVYFDIGQYYYYIGVNESAKNFIHPRGLTNGYK